MPRKSTKDNTMTVNDAINTPLNFQFDETAEKLGIGEPQLRERLETKLDNADVHTWNTIPHEYQPVIDAIARDLESEASVRRLTPPQEETPQLPPQPPILQEELEQSGAITEAPPSNKLADGVAQDLEDTQRIDQETLELQDLLFAAEADSKAQLVAAVKQHGWQVYSRLGSEIDAQTILQMAQEKLNNADAATNSRLGDLTQRLGMKSPEEIRQEIEKRKQDFFAQQQTRQQTWKTATSSQTSKA